MDLGDTFARRPLLLVLAEVVGDINIYILLRVIHTIVIIMPWNLNRLS